jgi:hypothetical protein
MTTEEHTPAENDLDERRILAEIATAASLVNKIGRRELTEILRKLAAVRPLLVLKATRTGTPTSLRLDSGQRKEVRNTALRCVGDDFSGLTLEEMHQVLLLRLKH